MIADIWSFPRPFGRRIGLAITAILIAPTLVHSEVAFQDSGGRKINVPTNVARVVPAGPPADLLAFAIAPDLLVGLVEPWSDEQRPFIPERYRQLPKVPRLTRDFSDKDVAAIKQLQGDLVIDYGDVNPQYIANADKAQAAVSIPTILLDGSVAATPTIIRRLGELLGRRDRAEQIAQISEKTLSDVAAVTAAVPDAMRPTVYYARGKDGLEAVRPGNVNGDVLDLAGGRNVTPKGRGTFVKLSVDEVKALAPSFVIVSDPVAMADGSPLRMALPPTTRFLLDEGRPFAWVQGPPSLNRIIGVRWLASRLNPSQIKFDDAAEHELNGALFGLVK
jgi:iron complex transport system substrate-binding protein